jgi:polar amino acid transport system substrate-binding protein
MTSVAKVQDDTPKAPLKLATGQSYSPYVDNNLPAGGWSVAIVQRALAFMSLRTEITILPWDRALKWTVEDKIFGTFPFVYSKKRADLFLFSKPINTVPIHMYASKNSSFTSLESLQTKRLCFPYDYSLSPIEQQIVNKFEMTINRVKDGISCIKHVHKGWSDAGLTNGYIDTNKLSSAQGEGKQINVFATELGLVPLHFVISKKRKDAQLWMDEFNYALSRLVDSGEISAINNQYLELLNSTDL